MGLSDAEAKKLLRQWPSYTATLFGGTDKRPWLQAQPKTRNASTPCLMNAGASAMSTRPDGMWIRILRDRGAADVFCVDVSGSSQNFQDKRARFLPSTSALVLHCSRSWLNESAYVNQPRWKKMGVFEERVEGDQIYPIRYLRVLFVLPDLEYKNIRDNGVASGHEYFMKHSSLGAFNSKRMQEFLKSISPQRHFYSVR